MVEARANLWPRTPQKSLPNAAISSKSTIAPRNKHQQESTSIPTLTLSSSSTSKFPNPSSSSSPSEQEAKNPPLFTNEHFEVNLSAKGGYGAFATKNITAGTVIMSEKPLFKANFCEVFLQYEQLTPKQREEYLTLHGWDGISTNKILSIFVTNRYLNSHCGRK